MEKPSSAVCALVLVLSAFIHIHFAADADGNQTVDSARPGACPRRLMGTGPCIESCSSDTDCPGKERCYHNGCGYQCFALHTVKRGRCAPPQETPMCADYCYHDGQCPGEQKCCRTTRGRACGKPC